MSEFSKNIDSVLGSFFNSITVKDKIEVIRAGKDAEKIYSFGYSPLDVYAKIRKSEPTDSNINFGKSLYQGIGDLVPELGPRAVVLLVSCQVHLIDTLFFEIFSMQMLTEYQSLFSLLVMKVRWHRFIKILQTERVEYF